MNKRGGIALDVVIILGIVVALAFLISGKINLGNMFQITGIEGMTRNAPTQVDAGSSFSVTYTATQTSGTWGATVEDVLTCPNMAVQDKKFVMLSTNGETQTVTFNAPSAEGVQCSLSGNFQYGTKSLKTFPNVYIATKVNIPVCASGADTNGDGQISLTEMANYITGWISGSVDRTKLSSAIMDWANGCGGSN